MKLYSYLGENSNSHDEQLKPGIGVSVFSGLINGVLMFVFSCVFSSLIFEACGQTALYTPVGVGVHTVSVAVSGLSSTLFSGLPSTIAGPDVNPALFFALMARTIVTSVDPTQSCWTTVHYGKDNGHRNLELLAAETFDPTTHRIDNCQNIINLDEEKKLFYAETAAKTILCAISLSTASIGLLFLCLGHFNLTRVVQFVPACVLSGFLACIGYKIMLKAVDAATGEHLSLHLDHIEMDPVLTGEFWAKLIPSIPIGFGLYFLKKHHIGSPLLVMPVVLGLPLILFYIVLAIANSSGGSFSDDIARAREDGWFYKEFEQEKFYRGWKTLFFPTEDCSGADVGSPKLKDPVTGEWSVTPTVDWKALSKCSNDGLVMLLIVAIDALLKLAGTKKKLELDNFSFNYEVKLSGMYNVFINSLMLGAPGYSQLKFNKLNYSISGSVTNRLPGFICSGLNGALFLSGFMAINLMPRFWLGGLVIYAGVGFLEENLIESIGHMDISEYLAVWLILLVGIFNELINAILIGICFSLLIFAFKYGRRGVIRSKQRGSAYTSMIVRPPRDQRRLRHLGKLWCVIELHRYLFFGSVYQVQDEITEIINYIENKKMKGRYGVPGQNLKKSNAKVRTHEGSFFSSRLTQLFKMKSISQLNISSIVATEEELPLMNPPIGCWEGFRFIIIDFTHVDGIDFTGASVFVEIVKQARNAKIKVIFSGLGSKMTEIMQREGVLQMLHGNEPAISMAVEGIEDGEYTYNLYLFFPETEKSEMLIQ
eukprot:g1931.t1